MTGEPRLSPGALAVAIIAALAHVIVNLTTPYGIHRDEFLYLSMGQHLRLWQMDFPPFIAIAANVSRAAGEHIAWLRLLPAIAHGLLVVVAADAARAVGGRTFAQLAAATAVLLSPLLLRTGNLLQPVVFDQLWWSLALLSLLYLRRSGNPRWWLAIGVALGLGLLTKFSVAFVGLAIGAAVLVGAHRRELLTPWPWLAVALTLAIGSPSLAGQLALDWPVIGQMGELRSSQLARVSYAQFLFEQPLMLGPPAFILAIGGMAWLVFAREGRFARDVGVAALLAFLLVMIARGKPYYIGAVYPVLLGVGAVLLQRIVHHRMRTIVQATFALTIIAGGVLTLPLGVPVLTPAAMMDYTTALGITSQTNVGEPVDLPQDYADMLGWERLADSVAAVYRGVPPAEQPFTVILADNYGRAGALEFYGASRALPEVVSPAGSFWFFGPGRSVARTIIVTGDHPEEFAAFCGEVRQAGLIEDRLLVPEERRVPIHLCTQLKTTLQESWPALR